jgi:hypothetical protein
MTDADPVAHSPRQGWPARTMASNPARTQSRPPRIAAVRCISRPTYAQSHLMVRAVLSATLMLRLCR